MPTYEYQCDECEEIFTQQLSISRMYEPEKEACPSCSKHAVKKKILSGVLFNADALRMDGKYRERVREWKRTIPHNTLPDL